MRVTWCVLGIFPSPSASSSLPTQFRDGPRQCNSFFLHTSSIFTSGLWAILHELCTLKHTFTSNNLLGLVFQIMQAKPPPISPEYGEDVQSLLNKL